MRSGAREEPGRVIHLDLDAVPVVLASEVLRERPSDPDTQAPPARRHLGVGGERVDDRAADAG